jgi:hypothetical protein
MHPRLRSRIGLWTHCQQQQSATKSISVDLCRTTGWSRVGAAVYGGENIFSRLKPHKRRWTTMSPCSASARVPGAAELRVDARRTPVGSHRGRDWDSRTIPLEHPNPYRAGSLAHTTPASRIGRIRATRRSRLIPQHKARTRFLAPGCHTAACLRRYDSVTPILHRSLSAQSLPRPARGRARSKEYCPPKAGVTGSNPVGCASKINHLDGDYSGSEKD